jgi:ankyrin repeat protein
MITMHWSLNALDTKRYLRIGCTPLHQSVSTVLHDKNPIHLDIMRLIINSKADINKYWGPEAVLHTAIKYCNEEVVALLLDANANVNLKYERVRFPALFDSSCTVLTAVLVDARKTHASFSLARICP